MVAIAWIWWQLWQWVLVFVLAAFMAVALDPIVQWLEAHRIRRRYGAPLVVLLIVLALAGFFACQVRRCRRTPANSEVASTSSATP